jgi:multicomponent Na+:H+ antiporter subunit D
MKMFIPLFVVIPIGTAFLTILLTWKFKKLADIFAVCATLSLFILAIMLPITGTSGSYTIGGWPFGIGINFVIDGFSTLMLIIINLISFAATIFSISYMKQYTAKYKYYGLFLLMVAGMNGVVMTGDMFNLFVFLEIASIASYALVAFGCEHEELEASFKYLVLGSIGSTLVLLGIALTYGITGSLNMAAISTQLSATATNLLVIMISALFIVGFGIKAALVPFHPWLPDAHPSAPAPISAMLSGVLIKALGVYALARILFNVIGVTPIFGLILIILGVLSMTIGVFLAVGQWDFKRLLAYHSISQMGYVVLGIGLGAYMLATDGPIIVAGVAMLGGIFHLTNHAVFKSLLFLCSGSVQYATGTRQLKEMGGLKEKMPLTRFACTVASLSIAGVPPFNGFWSKLVIVIATIMAALHNPAFLVLTVIALVVSFVTLVSFLKVLRYTFLGMLKDTLKEVKESPFFMGLAMVILALFCIGMGTLLIPQLRQILLEPAVNALTNGLRYAESVVAGF